MRILTLGDSYTIGTSVEPSESWPYQLVERVNAEGIPAEAPQVVAQNGWTTRDLAAGIEEIDPQGPYDLVTLLIGVNNQFRGYDIDEYQTEFRQLLEQAIHFAGGDNRRVLVLSIPDWGVTSFATGRDAVQIAAEIDAFNAVNLEETTALGAQYLDVTAISRQAATDRSLLAADGLHPSAKMYAQWVEAIMPVIWRFEIED
jgi:lysophospholipase L1-like esterase